MCINFTLKSKSKYGTPNSYFVVKKYFYVFCALQDHRVHFKERTGQYVLDVKHIAHLEHTIVEYVKDVFVGWIIIVHGKY